MLCNHKRFIFLIIVLFSSWFGEAQTVIEAEIQPEVKAESQPDSLYIRPFPYDFSIHAGYFYKYTTLNKDMGSGEISKYMSNSPTGVGLGFSYKRITLFMGIGLGFLRDNERGKTKSIDFQYHYYGRKFIMDFFFHRYKGFYRENGEISLHPDVSFAQYGVSGEYIFNNRKFSYRAAFGQKELQLRSAGSFQLGGGVYYNKLNMDSSLYINENQKFNNYQIALSGGYAYTAVIKKRFFASASMSLGVNLGLNNLSDMKKVEVLPTVLPRISLGYNADNWSIGLSSVLNSLYVTSSDDLKLFLDTGMVRLTFSKRIGRSPKILQDIKYLNM